jgi:hypothetical protein
VVRAPADRQAASTSIQAVAWLSSCTTCRRSAILAPIPLRPRVRRGVPVPAVAAYPNHRPEIQFIRPVAHVAHRPAGVHVQDGLAEAGAQAEDREPDPVQFGKRDCHGSAAVARRSRPGVPAVGVRQHAQPQSGRKRVAAGRSFRNPGHQA